MIKTIGTFAVAAVAAGTFASSVAAEAQTPKPRVFANCTAMNKVYPHGVGKVHAIDKTSGKRVTNFTKNTALYTANKKSDRDKDGIACEKH